MVVSPYGNVNKVKAVCVCGERRELRGEDGGMG